KGAGLDVLSRDREYVRGREHASNGVQAGSTRVWAQRRRGNSGWRSKVCAEGKKDASPIAALAVVGMGLGHIPAESRVGQRVGEGLIFLVQVQLKRALACFAKNGPGLSVERAELFEAR